MEQTRKIILTVAACATLLCAGTALATSTPPQKCEAGKNDAAGKYAACLQTAEKNLVLNGDTTKYATAVAKCDATLATKWTKLEQAAVAKGTACPSTGDEAAMQTFLTANADTVGGALHTPPLPVDVATCNADVSSCNAGTATVGNVLSGKTFSSSAGLGGAGTMPNNGAVTLTPGTSNQLIPAGYHNGAGFCAGDANLVPGNIKSGVTIFGVTGTTCRPNLYSSPGGGCDPDLCCSKWCCAAWGVCDQNPHSDECICLRTGDNRCSTDIECCNGQCVGGVCN
jgi:hypothetical protein